MRYMFDRVMAWIIQGLLSLRYRIHVEGWEEVCKAMKERGPGILFLPNHPAEIDPVILMSRLWERFHPHPLVVEHFYYIRGFGGFMRYVGALPLSHNDGAANKWRRAKFEATYHKIVEGLQRGENFLIYPGGRLKTEGREIVGGASMVHNILRRDFPEARVVLIRTTGLWGSSFSRALIGRQPSFGGTLLRGMGIVLKNLIFFTPRRDVKIQFSLPPEGWNPSVSRRDFNHFLEGWYNRYPEAEEPMKRVSFAFWKEQLPVCNPKERPKPILRGGELSPQDEKMVLKQIAALAQMEPDKIEKQQHLSRDLGLDSLDVAQLYLMLDEKFHVEGLPPGTLETVEDVLLAAAGACAHLEEEAMAEGAKLSKGLRKWLSHERPPAFLPEGSTISESFLLACDRMGSSIACTDALTPPLSYRDLKMRVLLLAEKFEKLPGQNVAVLLPSSVGAQMIVQALLLAGKVPVMLNWTVGLKALSHATEVTKIQVVLSSQRFLERLEEDNLGELENKLLLLEDLRASVTLINKLRALFLSRFSAASLLKRLPVRKTVASDTAVILFTSGTETLPKGVPLTHANLLENLKAAFSCVKWDEKDIFYGVLPPFHSFGFSPDGMAPLLMGLRICYGPNPTDSSGMARDIARWRPTVFVSAPSFLKNLLAVAKKEQLASVRLFVVGAEKAPDELFTAILQLGHQCDLIEGYGITECSPVATIMRQGEPKVGVGRALPGVDLITVHPETGEKLPEGAEGEVCIAGPNVFSGYLGEARNPFLDLTGRRWYRSGDFGKVDSAGNLLLMGRLKRFVKVGGEMVSLMGLEQEIAKSSNWPVPPEQQGKPLFAVGSQEAAGEKTRLILFTPLQITKEQVNNLLKLSGYGRIARIAEVRQLPEIPLTGTGKIHYRMLDDMLKT